MARTRLPSKGRPALPHHGRVLFDCGVGGPGGSAEHPALALVARQGPTRDCIGLVIV